MGFQIFFKQRLSVRKLVFLTLLIFLVVVIIVHNVPKKITEDDVIFIEKIIQKPLQRGETLDFSDQINLVRFIQQSYHEKLMLGNPIDYSLSREPKDLFENKGGICYDFSRSIEKALIYSGFKTRHISLYKKTECSLLKTILKQSIPSHSSTEVKTKNGWMIVDSNLDWIAIDTSGNVFSARKINQTLQSGKEIIWETPVFSNYEKFYNEPHYVIYGLYSRHGKFYPPFTVIPDYNLCELLYNFKD